MTRALAAMVVALAAMGLTPSASAQQDPLPDTSSAVADRPTPLALRPNKPLELAQEPRHVGAGWKLFAAFIIVCGGAFYARKRLKPRRADDGGLTIVRRASIGMRSELLIVNVEGQRLLIGVTPHTIQTLATLDVAEEADALVSRPDRGPGSLGDEAPRAGAADVTAGRGQDLGGRFAAMLKAADTGAGSARTTTSAEADEPHVAGQARGLLGLRRRG